MPVLTIRTSQALHVAFRELAYHQRRSMNEIAVQLLTQAVLDHPEAKRVFNAFDTTRACNEYDPHPDQDQDPRSP